MKVFNIVLIAAWTILCVAIGLQMAAMPEFGPNPIDSWVDIVFIELICFGGWLVILVQPFMFFARTPYLKMRVAAVGTLGALAFIAGLYYHVIFSAPW